MVDLSQQPPPPPRSSNEEQARTHLTELKALFEQRADAVDRDDKPAVHSIEVNIVVKMRQIGDTYPDTESKSEWYEKAKVFEEGSDEDKKNILMPLAQGLGILIAAPFAVAGGAIFAAGGILYGAGKTVLGVGNLLTGGVFHHEDSCHPAVYIHFCRIGSVQPLLLLATTVLNAAAKTKSLASIEMNNHNPPPPYNNRERLQELLRQRADALARGNHAEVAVLDAQITYVLRGLGDIEPNAEERRRWHNLADNFRAGDAQERENILMPIAKGLGIIIATPFILAGGATFAAGSILYGAGKVVQGVGSVLTGGTFR